MKKLTRVYYTPEYNDTEAQKWLFNVLNQSGMTQAELAERLHTTRQSMSKMVNGQTELTFDKICAICYVTGFGDPEEIWHAVSL